MPLAELETILRELPRVGRRGGNRLGGEAWKFSLDDQDYVLIFYPGRDGRALRSFKGLTTLQRHHLPAVRAAAVLNGFRLEDRTGDALLLDGPLRPTLREISEDRAAHRRLVGELIAVLRALGKARLGHDALGLDAFVVVTAGDLQFADGLAVRRGGLRMRHLLCLDHDAGSVATTTDRLRVWRALGLGSQLPSRNALSPRLWRRDVRRSLRGDNDRFGSFHSGDWHGRFDRIIPPEQWQSAWPALLEAIENDQLEIIKRSDNGDVLRGELILAGRPRSVIVKRPRRKTIRQTILDLVRPSRARRTWTKTWQMIVRGIACERPLLLMEKRVFGYVTDAVIVFDIVPGPTLAAVDLDARSLADRQSILFSAGRTLRRIETLGFTHADAKSTNWIVTTDAEGKPRIVLIDLDGVRHYRWAGLGIARLERAMKQHPQITAGDLAALRLGYEPGRRKG